MRNASKESSVRSRRGSVAALAFVALASLPACGSPANHAASRTGTTAKNLMIGDKALQMLLAQDAHLRRTFAHRTTYMTSRRLSRPAVPPLPGAVEPTAAYTSFAAFAADIAAGRVPSSYHAVLYDIEKWPATPVAEQRRPRQYMVRFSKLARTHGLLPVLAPARDLVLVRGASCVKRVGENLNQAYLRCGLAGADAYAAVLVVQSQVSQAVAPVFRKFLALAARQARAGNGRIRVLAQLATAPLGRPASPAELVAAARSVGTLVQGFSLNVRLAEVPVADRLLWSFAEPRH